MIDPERVRQSDYMYFAKFQSGARFNLASSGVADCTLADIGPDIGDLALHGPNADGYGPLIEAIAGRFGVAAECVVMPGGGCSFANHLAMAALISPGDEVLIEEPTYELMVSTLGYLQANIVRLPRRAENAWALHADEIAGRITERTRLVVLTNLHNPSSTLTDPATIEAIAASAARVGAHVLIDEVYLELMFRDGIAQTAVRPDGNIIVTSSLTKAYGLSGLRCCWILAPPDMAKQMRRLNDLYGVAPPHIAERLSVVALNQLEALRTRANRMLDENRAAYREILGGHPGLEQTIWDQGTTVFPRLTWSDGDRMFELLTSEFETSVVPGRFFGRPEHVRIGLGGDPVDTREGLQRFRAALDQSRPSSNGR